MDRIITCPEHSIHKFADQVAINPLQGGPILDAPIELGRLKFRWGCTGLSDKYTSGCPGCKGVLEVLHPRAHNTPEEYNVDTPTKFDCYVRHDGDDDCPGRHGGGEHTVTAVYTKYNTIRPPYYTISGIEEALTEAVRNRLNERNKSS